MLGVGWLWCRTGAAGCRTGTPSRARNLRQVLDLNRSVRRAGERDVGVWSFPEGTADRERRTFIRLSSPEGTALLSTFCSR